MYRLTHGTWRDADFPSPCALITDPPFGMNYRAGRSEVKTARSIVGDDTTKERDDAMVAIGWEVAAVFGVARDDRIPHWGDPRGILIWSKGSYGMGDLRFPWKHNYETIAIYGATWAGHRGSGVLEYSRGPHRSHPNEKPVDLMRHIIAKVPAHLPIVDPFMGSGSTGVAAVSLGRDFYGAEIDRQHFDTAKRRLGEVQLTLV